MCPGLGASTSNAVAHQHRFLDIVRHHQHRFDRQLAPVHRSMKSVRKVSAVSTSSAENGSSIRSTIGSTDDRPGKTDALAHAAGKLARIGGLKSVEADEIDGRRAPACVPRRRGSPSASRPASTFSSTVSQGNKAKV